MKAAFAVLVSTLMMIGCGGTGGGSSGGGSGAANRNEIVWTEISADHHPEIAKVSLALSGVDTVNVDLFGFVGDFAVVYDPKMAAGQGRLDVYRVWKESASFGSIVTGVRGSTLAASSNGTYECSIRVENQRITQLKGGCIVRVEVVLPVGSEVEVYNLGELKSRRFKPMSVEALHEGIRRAYRDDQRTSVIDQFLASYRETGKRPVLTASDVGRALHDFPFKDGKMGVLRKLHAFVGERESLRAMIDSEFTYFDRAEARSLVGLP